MASSRAEKHLQKTMQMDFLNESITSSSNSTPRVAKNLEKTVFEDDFMMGADPLKAELQKSIIEEDEEKRLRKSKLRNQSLFIEISSRSLATHDSSSGKGNKLMFPLISLFLIAIASVSTYLIYSSPVLKKNVYGLNNFMLLDSASMIFPHNTKAHSESDVPVLLEFSDSEEESFIPTVLSKCFKVSFSSLDEFLNHRSLSEKKNFGRQTVLRTSSLCNFTQFLQTHNNKHSFRVFTFIDNPLVRIAKSIKKTDDISNSKRMNSTYHENIITRTFSCKACNETLTEKDLNLAKAFLKNHCFVGMTNNYMESIHALYQQFGWEASWLATHNSNARGTASIEHCIKKFAHKHYAQMKNSQIDLKFDELQRITESNYFDMSLYSIFSLDKKNVRNDESGNFVGFFDLRK